MLKEKVEKVLEQIRPSLQADGGDVELIEVTQDGVVKLRLTGACGCCPMSTYTLKLGIEKQLKDAIPEVKKIEQVF
jgi:Fe-S cluster biogenesis protein NfuA